MIAKKTAKIKRNIQKKYNDFVDTIDFRTCQCCCKAVGRFVIHGYYAQKIRANQLPPVILVVQRMKCKSCGATHAILPSFIVPYSQILQEDMIGMIIAFEENSFYEAYYLTRKDVYYIIKKYKRYWREKILAILDVPITEFLYSSELIQKVHFYYHSAFMQIKRCPYLLFS